MQDMIPPQDRSIRNIPITFNARRGPSSRDEAQQTPPPRPRRPSHHSSSSHGIWLWGGGIIIICAVLGILLSTLFVGTTITLYPRTDTVTPGPITAAPGVGAGGLAYQTISLTRVASTTVTASGSQHISNPAMGVITIYNAYSSASQILVATTRFAAPDGKIYRIHSAVTVPGATQNNSGTLQPGSVIATVYADQPGAAYNRSDPTTFTIPGFMGDPRYNKFYAQSTNPISGGFVGNEPAVAKADLTQAETALKQSLNTDISVAITDSIPSGFIIIPGTLEASYSDISQTPTSSSSTVALSQNATGRAVMVKETDLAAAVAAQSVSGYSGEAVAFANPNAISVALSSGSATSSVLGPLSIQVSGPLTLQWQLDQGAIKQALLGKPKASFQTIIQAFEPAVQRAEAKVRPFWESTFPTDPNRITVVIATQ